MNGHQNSDLISVDQALLKGRQMLLLPRILMIIGLFVFLFPLVLLFMALTGGPGLSRNTWLVFSSVLIFDFVVFFYLPFLFWSKRTTRWKLWAFSHVMEYLAFKPNTSTIVFFIGGLLILSPLYLIVRTLINLFRHQPRIILNNKGIFTVETGFISWNDIFNEKVEVVDQGRRGVKYSLHFQYPGGLANIEITDYIKRSQLESLMRIYKGRFKAAHF